MPEIRPYRPDDLDTVFHSLFLRGVYVRELAVGEVGGGPLRGRVECI
jgi:hypothetical protein